MIRCDTLLFYKMMRRKCENNMVQLKIVFDQISPTSVFDSVHIIATFEFVVFILCLTPQRRRGLDCGISHVANIMITVL